LFILSCISPSILNLSWSCSIVDSQACSASSPVLFHDLFTLLLCFVLCLVLPVYVRKYEPLSCPLLFLLFVLFIVHSVLCLVFSPCPFLLFCYAPFFTASFLGCYISCSFSYLLLFYSVILLSFDYRAEIPRDIPLWKGVLKLVKNGLQISLYLPSSMVIS
jgi:energy-coupling factor transporter transmembrane protein EcfT